MLPAAGVSVEVEKPGRAGLAELAAKADVVFYSKSYAEVRSAVPNGYRHLPFQHQLVADICVVGSTEHRV